MTQSDLRKLERMIRKENGHTETDEDRAYGAGFDCGRNGANDENCHFKYFTKPELAAAWEGGKRAAESTNDKT